MDPSFRPDPSQQVPDQGSAVSAAPRGRVRAPRTPPNQIRRRIRIPWAPRRPVAEGLIVRLASPRRHRAQPPPTPRPAFVVLAATGPRLLGPARDDGEGSMGSPNSPTGGASGLGDENQSANAPGTSES